MQTKRPISFNEKLKITELLAERFKDFGQFRQSTSLYFGSKEVAEKQPFLDRDGVLYYQGKVRELANSGVFFTVMAPSLKYNLQAFYTRENYTDIANVDIPDSVTDMLVGTISVINEVLPDFELENSTVIHITAVAKGVDYTDSTNPIDQQSVVIHFLHLAGIPANNNGEVITLAVCLPKEETRV
jgi:hypothetical protein